MITAADRLSPGRVAGTLLAIHGLIAAINLSPLIDSYTVATLLDVNREGGAIVWFSSASLLAAAMLAGVAAVVASCPLRTGWWLVTAAFVVLSLDETASLHEMAGEKASRVLEVSWLPSLYVWVIVVAPVAFAFAVWMLRWFGRTLGWRSPSGRLVMTAILVWMTVPVFEALDPALDGSRWLVTGEETVEGVGQALMLAGLIAHLRHRGVRVSAPIT